MMCGVALARTFTHSDGQGAFRFTSNCSKGPLGSLEEHPNRKVRAWARRLRREIDSEANSARDHDDEWKARMEL